VNGHWLVRNPRVNTLAGMRIDEILASTRPVFSVEFFPPKTEEGRETLFETVEVLSQLGPSFFSVTYGAGGATREGTVLFATNTASRRWPI
jgi:methylenetetrahydrofolate reductase (NADPH)